MESPPLSLYIHLPWCVEKCPYCDFNSHRAPRTLPESAYVAALKDDLQVDLARLEPRPLHSVFIGGGTPSLFRPELIGELLAFVDQHLPLGEVEITMEANPGTLEHGPWHELEAAGINRLSLGVQSLNDDRLRALGRIHDGKEALRAIRGALKANFRSVNVDLMFGLPGQDFKSAMADLDAIINLDVPHVSHYQLTIEPNTLFAARPPKLPLDDRIWEMQLAAQERLARAGLDHYEVSAYARAGHRSRHNLNYWEFGDYLGIGAGAHGKLTLGDRVIRTLKQRHPRHYMEPGAKTPRRLEWRSVVAEELPFEFVLNALRLVEGFAVRTYAKRTGCDLDPQSQPWRRLIEDQLLTINDGVARCTERGQRYLNDVLMAFLP